MGQWGHGLWLWPMPFVPRVVQIQYSAPFLSSCGYTNVTHPLQSITYHPTHTPTSNSNNNTPLSPLDSIVQREKDDSIPLRPFFLQSLFTCRQIRDSVQAERTRTYPSCSSQPPNPLSFLFFFLHGQVGTHKPPSCRSFHPAFYMLSRFHS
jgi:hypothetical protein